MMCFSTARKVYTQFADQNLTMGSKQVNLLIIVDGEIDSTSHQEVNKAAIKAEQRKTTLIITLHEIFEWFLDSISKRQAL